MNAEPSRPLAPPPFAQAPSLSRFTMHLRHGFFGRRGGMSSGPYDSLNAGPGSSDDRANVQANRIRACLALGSRPEFLLTLHQAHTNRCVTVEAPFSAGKFPEADALATRTPGLVLGVLAADCAPVLMCDPRAGVIAAAHAGWRGAVGGIVESALDAMAALGAEPSSIVAAVGPCLGKESFEVGPDLMDAVLAASDWAEGLFSPGDGDRSFFDLKSYILRRMARWGVGSSEALADDTLTQPDVYFSYRGSQKRGDPDYGRNLSVITLLA